MYRGASTLSNIDVGSIAADAARQLPSKDELVAATLSNIDIGSITADAARPAEAARDAA